MDRIKAMQVFVDVVNLGSPAAAANKLDMSRAMATRHIAALEDALGLHLLHRTNRSLGPTDSGWRILPICQRIVGLADEISVMSASNGAEPNGHMRVASSASFLKCYLAEALTRFTQRFPKTSIELITADHPLNLLEQRIDVAFQITDAPDPRVVSRRLAPCPMVLCATPSYLERHGDPRRPADLVGHNCLSHTLCNGHWNFIQDDPDRAHDDRACEAIPVSGNLSADNSVVLLVAALAGRGIACLPLYLAKTPLASGALVRVLARDRIAELGIFAFHPPRRHLPPTTRAMMDFITGELN